MQTPLAKQCVAEFIGTFALIFVGVGAIYHNAGLLAIALAHGLTIAVMVTATGHISGGHLNPAVTFGLWAGGRVAPVQAAVYVASQLVGASLAAALLLLVSPKGFSEARVHLAAATPDLNDVSVGQGAIIEAVLTFFLVFAVSGTAVDDRTP